MNMEENVDMELEISNFRIGKEGSEESCVREEEFITETPVSNGSFELVKCEMGNGIESICGNMISEEEIEEKIEDRLPIIPLDDNKDDIENILVIDDFRCGICLESFVRQEDLNLHLSLFNPNEVHHCNYCAQSFHTKRVWSAHMESHLLSKEFICIVCLRCCSSADELQTHLAGHYPEPPPRQSIKSETKASAKQSRKSAKSTGAKRRRRTYTCAVCKATYLLRRKLIHHLHNHKLICDACGQVFLTKDRLRYHIGAKHGSEPRNVCEPCDRGFCSKSALNRHQRLMHGVDGTPHMCHICNKCYASSSSLKTHSRIHDGQKQHSCADCSKTFMRKDRLDSHRILVHGVDGGHLCGYCGKRISRRENLKYHLRLHTGEKPFQCTVCPKTFPSQTALKKHTVIHTSSVVFRCHICERTIARKDNFLAHLRIHENREREACEPPPVECPTAECLPAECLPADCLPAERLPAERLPAECLPVECPPLEC